MALRLTLKAHERVIIGGAVIMNGSSRAELLVENRVPVLRETDILSPNVVRTPCERIYLALQLLYVQPEQAAEHRSTLQTLLADVREAAPSCRRLIERIDSLAAAGQLYQALKSAKTLLEREREIIAHVR